MFKLLGSWAIQNIPNMLGYLKWFSSKPWLKYPNFGNTRSTLGTSLGRFWDVFGTSLGRLWDVFGTSLGRLWDVFGTSLGYLWDVFWTSLGRFWDVFGTSLGRLWDPLGGPQGLAGALASGARTPFAPPRRRCIFKPLFRSISRVCNFSEEAAKDKTTSSGQLTSARWVN